MASSLLNDLRALVPTEAGTAVPPQPSAAPQASGIDFSNLFNVNAQPIDPNQPLGPQQNDDQFAVLQALAGLAANIAGAATNKGAVGQGLVQSAQATQQKADKRRASEHKQAQNTQLAGDLQGLIKDFTPEEQSALTTLAKSNANAAFGRALQLRSERDRQTREESNIFRFIRQGS